MTTEAFYTDALGRSERRIKNWYSENLINVLEVAKKKQAREIDVSIALAEDLLKVIIKY